MKRSQMLQTLMQSEIRNMSIECDQVQGINLSQGVCDLPLPEILQTAARDAIAEGKNHYTRYDGTEELRKAITSKLARFNGIAADPDTQVCVNCGATGAFYCACYALFDPGDEILLFAPFYGYHVYTLAFLELTPVYALLQPPAWSFDFTELESLVTERTKAILINTPANPCGKVFTKKELEELAAFAIRYNLIVLTDEIYEYITYDTRNHVSPASLESIQDRTITISGYSKTFSITGWRIGYSVAKQQWTQKIGTVNDMLYVCAPAPLQAAVAQAIENLKEDYYQTMRTDYQKKRDLLCQTLQDVNLMPYVPQGAYYVLADVSLLPGSSSKEKAIWLLEKTGLGAVPGEAFFNEPEDGKNLLRFCFAKDLSVIEEACERLLKHQKEWRG